MTPCWGNPPWENLQPNAEEFFSNEDPLFRTYGRLEKQEVMTLLFEQGSDLERRWLDYSSDFAAFSHWVDAVQSPFGDAEGSNAESFPLGRGGKPAFERWRGIRQQTPSFSSRQHPFRHQVGRIFTYKLFLESSHALLRHDGRFGEIVPSGIYSDSWSRPLRLLFLDRCRWEWLFGFENRDRIFQIHRSSKFNPIIVQKGATTRAMRAAFMRRRLEDWESAEAIATPYSREQVERLSPKSKSILEIQSQRDLEILERIYADSVLLGDEGADGWDVRFSLEFMMNTHARLFPPRPQWEADGYRPDEYGRWLKGDWRPIAELWTRMGIEASHCAPLDDERAHRMSAQDVQPTSWAVRCAQPPYDRIPMPRADLPVGIVLSSHADAWIEEGSIQNTALPLYEGRMIGQFDFSEKGWVSGKGRGAKWADIPWSEKSIRPQYCMSSLDYGSAVDRNGDSTVIRGTKLAFMDVTAATNRRTMVAAVVSDFPCGNSAPVLGTRHPWVLSLLLNSFAYDFAARRRCAGLHLNWFVMEETPLPSSRVVTDRLALLALRPGASSVGAAAHWLRASVSPTEVTFREAWALTNTERLRHLVAADAIAFALFRCGESEVRAILEECHLPIGEAGADPKGFWRVDNDKDPELRHTILTLVAFADLQAKIRDCGGDREKGIDAFLNQNDGEGWMLPETLRLADYGLGQDERAKVPQPVASCFGPRFYDWQLAQTAEESWRECQIHARNLAGDTERPAEVNEATITPGPSESVPDSPPSSLSSRGRTAATQPSFFRDDAHE